MFDFLTPQFFLLMAAGVFISAFAVVVGGALFVSIPFIEWVFPQATMGVVIGYIKVSSFFRGIASTAATCKQIDFIQNIKIMPLALVGTVLGATTISNIDQRWLLPAIICAIIFTLQEPKWAHRVTGKTFAAATFVTGLYYGILGAGTGVILVALMRLKHPQDTEIAFVKIQARFIEFLLVAAAAVTHIINGNLVAALWLPLSIGGLVGGYGGGLLLRKMGELSAVAQKRILYVAFAVDLIVATRKFFE